MKKYSEKCSCGQVMSVDATTMEEAKMKMKAIMTQAALDDHFAKFHKPEETKPTLEMAHAMIEQTMYEEPQVAAM